MKISEMITDKYKLRITPTVYYELLADVQEVEEEQEPTTKNNLGLDCISRADAIKAMQNKAKKLKNEDTINGLCGAVAILYEMPSVTPQEPTTKENLAIDLIDRTELLKAIDTWDKFGNDPDEGLIPLRTPALQDRYVPYVHYYDVVNCVKGMPSVTPQLSIPEVTALAEWIEKLTKECEEAYNKGFTDGVKSVNICPHCGEYIGEEE